jgi:hypothetical protein
MPNLKELRVIYEEFKAEVRKASQRGPSMGLLAIPDLVSLDLGAPQLSRRALPRAYRIPERQYRTLYAKSIVFRAAQSGRPVLAMASGSHRVDETAIAKRSDR